jgi:hypothetical protein
MPFTKRPPLKKQPLTPMRSPIPRGRGGGRGGGGRNNTLPETGCNSNDKATSNKSPKAASSSEKETPTVVLTAQTKNISPYNLSTNCDNPSSSNKQDSVEEERTAVMKREREGAYQNNDSTQQSTRSKRNKFRRDLSADEESLGGDDDMRKKFRDDFSEESSGDEEDDCLDNIYNDENIVNAVQHLLQNGIASICRLRKLFPTSFFATFDLDNTSVTQFNVEYIEQALRKSVNGESNDEEYEEYDGDDDLEERSMMKSISTKRSATQKTVSPLTGASQWLSQYDASQRGKNTTQPDFGGDDEGRKTFQKRAIEALTLVTWMHNTTKIFNEGKLARVVFSICDGTTNELIESYSFQLSFAEHSQPGELQMTQFKDSTGSFFRNLNGYYPSMPLSQALLPARTQSSLPSQGYTQASSQYCTQQHVPLSQKHHTSQSLELTQRSIMMSMTQSIRSIRAKNTRGYQIPDSRYLSLDVKFTNEIEVDDLPDVFQEQDGDTTSPFPAEGGMDHFLVTPLGTISESCLAGLKVDMHAYSRSMGRKEDEDDERSVYFSQHSHSRPDPEFDAERSTSSNSETSGSEDSDSLAYAIPYGLSGKDVYLPCKFLGHRQSTKVNGNEKEEFKFEFYNELLTLKGKKKQWIPSKNVLSSTEMHTKIKRALKARCTDAIREGVRITSFNEVERIAKELKVQDEVVKSVAEKIGIKVRDVKKKE